MKTSQLPITFCVATAVALVHANVLAKEAAMPATMEEMWTIIQQQQKEIDLLKKRTAPNEPTPNPPAATNGQATTGNTEKAAKTDTDRKTDILASEVQKLKTQLLIPEKREYKSEYGLGPAASGVYKVNRGMSIGGYGEAFYTDYTGDKGTAKDTLDLARAVLYFGYKFNDWIILNNEIEYEHATTGEGSEEKGEVSVEFSQLDFLLNRYANVRAGLMLMPMGFINEIHEPVTFHGNRRPDVERFIIPSTWREMGAGLFGQILPGLQYRMYAVNGLNAKGYESSGIAEGRQGGSMALAEDFAFTGRLDYTPGFVSGLTLGASTYMGNAGQDNRFHGDRVDAYTQLHEGHLQWHYKGWEFRALGAFGSVDNAAALSMAKGETIGKQNYGWYAEGAYDVMPLLFKDSSHYLAPFFRYEQYDSLAKVATGFNDDGRYDRWIYQGGLTYKPIPNIAIKADYRNIRSASGTQPDEFNLGVGFIY
ncbi:MAG: hypothetical protein ACR2HF_12780 [Methylococcaceae bacterium]